MLKEDGVARVVADDTVTEDGMVISGTMLEIIIRSELSRMEDRWIIVGI